MRLLFSSNCFLLDESLILCFTRVSGCLLHLDAPVGRGIAVVDLLKALCRHLIASEWGKFQGAYNVMQIFIPKLNKIHSFNFIDFSSHWTGFCCDIKSLSSAFCRREEFVLKEIRLVDTTRFYERDFIR